MSNTNPQRYPTNAYNLSHTHKVDPRLNVQRKSVASYYDVTGELQTAAIDVPRIDFDPLTGECRGLLIEPTRTNSMLNSTILGGKFAVYAGVTVDCSSDGAEMNEGTGKQPRSMVGTMLMDRVEMSISFDVYNNTYETSQNTSDLRGLIVGIGDWSSTNVKCDLVNGTVELVNTSTSTKITNARLIRSIDNTVRVQFNVTLLSEKPGTTQAFTLIPTDTSLNPAYAGTNVKLLFSNMQVEHGTQSTSYVATTATTTATRLADYVCFSTYPGNTLVVRLYSGHATDSVISAINTNSSEYALNIGIKQSGFYQEVYLALDPGPTSQAILVPYGELITIAISATPKGYWFCVNDSAPVLFVTTVTTPTSPGMGGIITFGDITDDTKPKEDTDAQTVWIQRLAVFGPSFPPDELSYTAQFF